MDPKNGERLDRCVALLHRSSLIHLNKNLKKYNLKSTTFPILLNLEYKENNTVNKIAKELHFDKSIVSRGVKELTNLGYIKKEVSPTNKSSYLIYLTKEGKEILPKINEIITNYENHIFKNLGVEERKKLMTILKESLELSESLK